MENNTKRNEKNMKTLTDAANLKPEELKWAKDDNLILLLEFF